MDAKRLGKLFFPDEEVRSVHDIDYERLAERGKKGIIFDLDNTLGPWRSESFDQDVLDLFSRLHELGFRVGILSNGSGEGIRPRLKQLSYPVILGASKPRKSGFKEMLANLNLSPDEAVMVGDQLLTDVLGANRADIYSILVKPVFPNQESIFTKINRYGESLVFGTRWLYRFLRSLLTSRRNTG